MERVDELDLEHAAAVSADALQLMSELNVPIIPPRLHGLVRLRSWKVGCSPQDNRRSAPNKRRFDKAVNRELHSTFLQSNGVAPAGQTISEELSAVLVNVRDDLTEAAADNKAQALGLTAAGEWLRKDPQIALARLASISRWTASERNTRPCRTWKRFRSTVSRSTGPSSQRSARASDHWSSCAPSSASPMGLGCRCLRRASRPKVRCRSCGKDATRCSGI